jgi:hypothetical protein
LHRIRGGTALSPDGTNLAVWDLVNSIVIYNVHNREAPDVVINVPQISPFDVTINVELDMIYVHGGQEILIGSNVGQPVLVNVAQRRVTGALEHSPGMSQHILIITCGCSKRNSRKCQHYRARGGL